ncbi:MAG: hypothetical protein ALECFALPRED_007750 [Alectoria fallacina]|uniref:Uncharacterized protein n=1 Tax=Alectoria fallacina TaxID=1903189 RepID=A0A8H3J0X1_9LECA|nr:MAG: hypothetical protein ALECFALPRED_007750 [Alectoria fallacina]
MFSLLPAVALFLPLLPTLISAQCAACDSYSAALKSCQTTSAQIVDVGSTMDSTALDCMCTSRSNVTDMNTCLACDEANLSTVLNIAVLNAWTMTCTADARFGDQQAVNCWESQPGSIVPCVSPSSGSGNGSEGSDTDSGSDVATSASTGPTSLASSRSAAKSSGTSARSDAIRSWQAPVLLSVLVIGLSMVVEL